VTLFAARGLPSWAERVSNGPLSAVLREMAGGWDEEVAGLDPVVRTPGCVGAARRLTEGRRP
jgi:hypothetical protein